MWEPALMAEVARHTAPGGTFATYYRRGPRPPITGRAGFEVQRVPGYRSQASHDNRPIERTRMIESNRRLGIFLMIATTFVFAMQDGLSRHLAGEYNVMMVVMIRYWFFAAFVIAVAARRAGGIRQAAATAQLPLQILRGLLLAGEICVMVLAFVLLGLIESHAVFTSYPLLVAALSGPILGEKVGWRRWSAIGVGFLGVLIILNPRHTVFSVTALVPLASAMMFALYGLLTRYASRRDSTATSFFWTGVVGAIAMTLAGIWFWEPMTARD